MLVEMLCAGPRWEDVLRASYRETFLSDERVSETVTCFTADESWGGEQDTMWSGS